MTRSNNRGLGALLALALLLVSAVPAFAADAEPVLRGTVVGPDGRPFAVVDARATIFAPDGGGVVATRFEVAADGSFTVPLMPWGTSARPAQVRLQVEGIVGPAVATSNGCMAQYAPSASATFDVALANGADPDPVELVATEELVDEVCDGPGLPGATLPPTGEGPAAAVGFAPIVGLLASAATTVLLASRALPR